MINTILFFQIQMLYIAAISKQNRVAAKVHVKEAVRVLSIPEKFSDNLCISKKIGKRKLIL